MTQPIKINKMDLNKLSNQLVMTGFVAMVEDDGLSLHEAMEVMHDIQKQTAPAIMQIMSERRQGANGV